MLGGEGSESDKEREVRMGRGGKVSVGRSGLVSADIGYCSM